MSISDTRAPSELTARQPLRLDTLVRLRWLAVGGQLMAVLLVHFGLGYPTPLAACLGLIGLSALINLYLVFRYRGRDRPGFTFASLQLGYDSLQLSALLALTGGLQNPFSILLLAPVSVAATTLSQRATFWLALLVAGLASLISVWHLPLPWDPATRLVFDHIYVVGIWVALLSGVVFIATYTNRVAYEARQLANALAATELALSRHEQLNALDGLAAAAAHELGTPLSTIALAAKEMRDEVPPGPLADDVALIIEQSARCRAILAKLRNLGAEDGGDPFAVMPIGEVLEEVAQPLGGRAIDIIFMPPETKLPEPLVRRNVGLLYGLGNLIENATHFAAEMVEVSTEWDEKTLTVTITDDGPGYAPEVLARLGEPYLTTRARTPSMANAAEPGGLGLGIFIAKTLLERSGARLTFANANAQGNACVRISWPRGVIEAQ